MKLTISKIKYLITIYKLSQTESKIRSTDIAKILDVTKPSVHRAINELCKSELITKTRYSNICITQLGESLAIGYIKYFKIISYYFETHFGFDSEVANECAFSLIANLNAETLTKLCDRIKLLKEHHL